MNKPMFAEWGATQLELMARAFAHADAHGYCTLIHEQNPDARANKYLYRYFDGALQEWLKDWGRTHGRRCIVLHIYPRDDKFVFSFRVPRRDAFKPINAAFEIMSEGRENRWAARSVVTPKAMTRVAFSEYYEYRGLGRDNFELVLCILNMPHHREIMTGVFRTKQPKE